MKQTFVKAAVLACCMAAVGCKQAPMTMGPGEYAVMTIATTDREIPSNYSATIRGRQDIAIYPQVSGTISQLCVNEGQKVAKGQTLFIIDQVPYKAALQTAEANVEAAKAGVATAQLTYDSKKELFARNVVSQFDLSTANNNLLTAKAQLAQAEAQRRHRHLDGQRVAARGVPQPERTAAQRRCGQHHPAEHLQGLHRRSAGRDVRTPEQSICI